MHVLNIERNQPDHYILGLGYQDLIKVCMATAFNAAIPTVIMHHLVTLLLPCSSLDAPPLLLSLTSNLVKDSNSACVRLSLSLSHTLSLSLSLSLSLCVCVCVHAHVCEIYVC